MNSDEWIPDKLLNVIKSVTTEKKTKQPNASTIIIHAPVHAGKGSTAKSAEFSDNKTLFGHHSLMFESHDVCHVKHWYKWD